MRSLTCLVVTSLVLLTGCATALQPSLKVQPVPGFDLVDMSQVDGPKYQLDYAQCVAIANQDVMDVPRAAVGAVSTVAEKASLGLIGSKPSQNADRMTVLKRCLTGRGYTVLR